MRSVHTMELRTLRILVRVAEAGNISQAAAGLGTSQSSLSRAIAEVEREVGAALFYRTGRGVALTEVGESLLPGARRIVTSADDLFAEARDRAREPSGVVTLALMPTLTRVIAEPLFETARREHPRIQLRMLEGSSSHVAEWLADGRADVGLLSRFGASAPAGEEILSSSHMMLVAARTARASSGGSVRFRELARTPLVLPAPPNGTRIAIDRTARRLGITLDVVVETDSLEAQKAIVARHGCCTILDPKTVEDEVARGLFVTRPLIAPRLLRHVVIATTTQRGLSRAARHVMALVRQMRSSFAVPRTPSASSAAQRRPGPP
jgi:DNA-binding transcriptional LysR family regulator